MPLPLPSGRPFSGWRRRNSWSSTPSKEVLVQHTTLEEVQHLYEIVRALDKFAIRKVVGNLSARDVGELKRMTRDLGRFHDERDSQRYLEQNLRIHDRIWNFCGNKYLHEILVELMAKIAIYRRQNDFSPFSSPPALEKSCADHLALMDRLEARDLSGLEKLIESHWGEEFYVERG